MKKVFSILSALSVITSRAMKFLSKFSVFNINRSIPTRVKIWFMLFFGSFMIFMLRSNFSIIIIAMTEAFEWTNYEQSLLLGAYFCGYVFPNLIAGYLAERFGGRIVIFFVFFMSSFITLLSPLTANSDFKYLFVARFLLGVCGGFFFSTCHNLISRWAPPEEKGMFVSSLLGAKLGTAFTWPLMGLIIEMFDWQCAFYVTAFCSLTISLIWLNIVADSPDKHPKIDKVEKEYIESSLDLLIAKKTEFPPIGKMLKSLPFYALLFLHFSDVWGVFFLLTSAPMFMRQVLKFDLKNAGLVSSFPYIARLVFGFVFGAIGDRLVSRGYGATKLRKTFCILSHIVPGLFLLGFCIEDLHPYTCIALLTLSLGFNGAATLTSSQNPQDLAPNFAGSVYGLTNFFATMSGFISPLVVSYFTREQSTLVEWRNIFIIDGTLYISSAIFFMIFGSGEVQKWNRTSSYKDLMKL